MQSGWTGILMPLPMLSSSTVHQWARRLAQMVEFLPPTWESWIHVPWLWAQHSPGSWRHLRSESMYRALSLSFCHLSLKYMKKKNDPYDPQVPLHSDSATLGKLFSLLPPISWYWTRLQGSPSLLLILVPNYFLLPASGSLIITEPLSMTWRSWICCWRSSSLGSQAEVCRNLGFFRNSQGISSCR